MKILGDQLRHLFIPVPIKFLDPVARRVRKDVLLHSIRRSEHALKLFFGHTAAPGEDFHRADGRTQTRPAVATATIPAPTEVRSIATWPGRVDA